MPVASLDVDPLDDVFAAGLAAIRAELAIEDLPASALAEANDAVRAGPTVAAAQDLTDLPFVTIDPPGSRDLDQALHIAAGPEVGSCTTRWRTSGRLFGRGAPSTWRRGRGASRSTSLTRSRRCTRLR